jgi:hypothetical protein
MTGNILIAGPFTTLIPEESPVAGFVLMLLSRDTWILLCFKMSGYNNSRYTTICKNKEIKFSSIMAARSVRPQIRWAFLTDTAEYTAFRFRYCLTRV